MEPGFSETTFSHALYGEMLRVLPSFRAPYFPSTFEEFLVPFDMEWSLNARRSLFIQFKVSEYLDHPRAAQKNRVACPYYRFRLHHSHGTSTQHNLLKDLSDTFPGDVLYVAPMFYRYDEYGHMYEQNTIASNSVAVDINSMSWFTDSKRHCVAYNQSQIGEFSEWRDIGKITRLVETLDRLRVQGEAAPIPNREKQDQTIAHLKKVREALTTILQKQEIVKEVAHEGWPSDRFSWPRWFPYLDQMDMPREGVVRILELSSEVRRLARSYFGAYWIGLA